MLGVMTLFLIVIEFSECEFLSEEADVSVIASYLGKLVVLTVFAVNMAEAAPGVAPTQSAVGACSAAPQEFRLSSQGAVYSCRKLACDGRVEAEPASPSAQPVASIEVQPFCDGAFRFLVRSNFGIINGGEFAGRDRCLRAAEQFRTYKGCFCGVDFTPRCFASSGNKGARFDELGTGFTRFDSCLKVLEQLKEAVEVKPR